MNKLICGALSLGLLCLTPAGLAQTPPARHARPVAAAPQVVPVVVIRVSCCPLVVTIIFS